MKILVTGGLGFIGSHVITVLSPTHDIVIIDNEQNACDKVLPRLTSITEAQLKYIHLDLSDEEELNKVFADEQFDAVFHLAQVRSVVDSTAIPLDYYTTNIGSTISLLKAMQLHNCKRLVFSSTAQVYGSNGSEPISESEPTSPCCPYGWTKVFCEQILTDICAKDPEFAAVSLRYFNPVGAHETGLIGEHPMGTTKNIMPCIEEIAIGRSPLLTIFGQDFLTPDGTGMRDYIHIMDLAEGHLAALNNITPGHAIYNLGTGMGTTVLELRKAYEIVSEKKIPYEFAERRPGDVGIVTADVTKAEQELGWKATRDVIQICHDSWNWVENNPDGYV